VTMARANWSTGYMQAAIYKALLEELGYEVNEPADLELPPSNFFTALGEGEIDFWANSWYPGHASWWNNELTDGSIVGDKISVVGEEMMAGGLQGFLTNKSIVDENPGLTLDQIAGDPDMIAMYDASDSSPGDGIVQILGCPEDWTCDDIINENIEFAGWNTMAQTKAGYDAMVAEAVGRAADGLPFIIYTWTPSAYVTQLIPGDNAMWLAMEADSVLDGSITPEFDQRIDGVAVPAALGTDTCSADPCHLGWVAADIQVSANNEFLAANPAAAALLEQVKISVIDVALQNVLYDGGENTTEDVNGHAADWIAANRDQVDEWLATAIAAG
jgi:glycine betaine/proline transport system substrate-binding protein